MDKLELNLLSLEENGEAELEEAKEVSVSSIPCGVFSIRNYVAGVRKVDIKKCWPFSPQLLETKLPKGVGSVLPPLIVPKCRYWRCTECVESVVMPDDSKQETNAQKQLDALDSDALIQNFGNLCTKQLGKKEYISDYLETSVLEAKSHIIIENRATSHVSKDRRSQEAAFICSENSFDSRDVGAVETKTAHLAGNEIIKKLSRDELHQSGSECKTFFGNSTSSPTDLELIRSACQSICANSSALVDEVAYKSTAEGYMPGLNATEKAQVFPHASIATDSVERYRTVNRSDQEDEDDVTTKNERHHFINDNLDRIPCKLIGGCNSDKDDYVCTSVAGLNDSIDDNPIQLSANTSTEKSMWKVKKSESKLLKENGKTQKKRLLADLIATAPSQQIRWDGENQNQAYENSPRKARFGTWNKKSMRIQKSSKNGMHGWKELNSNKEVTCELPYSMLEIIQETRRPDEEGVVTNSLQRLQIDDLAMGLKKGKLAQKTISDEIQETKTAVDSDDDLMDLAGFLAQKQLERISSFPSSGIPKSKHIRRLQKNPTRHKLKHVLTHKEEEMSEQVQLQPNSSLTEGLLTIQDALRNSPDQVASEKSHPCLIVEQGQEQLVQVIDSILPEELNVSKQGKKENIIIAERDRTVSVSKDISNCTGKAHEEKLCQEGMSDASIMIAQKSCKGHSSSQRKYSGDCDLKKPSVSPKYGNGIILSQDIPKNDNPNSSAESEHQQNQFLDSYIQEKSIMSKQTQIMRKGHGVKHASFIIRKRGNKEKYCASKRLGSTTKKSVEKLKSDSNHDLTGEQKTCTHITAAEAPSDERDQVERYLMSQGLTVSRQATVLSENSAGNEVYSNSNDSSNDRTWHTVKNSSHRNKKVNFISMTGTKEKESSASQCKSIAASVSDKESIVLKSQPVSSTAVKQGKGSSTFKMKNLCTNKPIDGRNLSPNQAIRTQVSLKHNLAGVGSEDGQTDPVAGESQEMSPNEVSLMQENDVMARGDDMTCSKIGDGVIVHSRDSLDIPIPIGENKSGQKCKSASRKPNDEGCSRSQRKRSSGKISTKERKALAKSEVRQMSIIEETNAALNAAFSNGNTRKPQFAGSIIKANGHCSDRYLKSGTCKKIPPESAKAANCKGLTAQQPLIKSIVAPTSKDREELIIIDDSVELTLSSDGILADSSKMSCKTVEAENFKDDNLNTRTLGPKPVSIHEPEREPWHSSGDSPVQPMGQKSLIRIADARLVLKNQDALEHDNSLVQSHGNPFSNGIEKQSLSNATCLPAKDNLAGFLGSRLSRHVPNSSGSCNSLRSLFPHVNLVTPSTDSAPEFNQCSPSNLTTVFGSAQGNQVNIPSKLFKETSWQSNYNLNLYIPDRINAQTTNLSSGYESCKQNASILRDTATRKHSEPHQTITRNMLGCSSARTITGFEAFNSDPLKQNLVGTMTSDGKVGTNQRIEKISYINVLTNTRQVRQANQNMQTTSIPLTKTGSVAKIKDFASKKTMQSKYVEPESLEDMNNLTLGLAPNISKDQIFWRKSPIVAGNVRNRIEIETWEGDTFKQNISSMHDNAKAVLTSQSHTSLMPKPPKRLKLATGHMNFLNIPAQKTKQHIPIYSTFPSMPESLGGKYFQSGPKTYSDQYGGLTRASDRSFQMETRTNYNISNASENAFVSSSQENVRTDVPKGLYGRAGTHCFIRPVIGGNKASGGASDKEGSVLTSVCKDSLLELTLSIQQSSDRVKQL